MKKLLVLWLVLICVGLCSCTTGPDQVVDKVMVDFGLKPKPEGYVSASDEVFKKLDMVGAAEIKRMNIAGQHGDVKFQKENELRGKYYKEVKVYEGYFPTEATPASKTGSGEGGYYGYIEFSYRMYQSMREDSSSAAEAATADIPTDTTGRETYRYTFGSGGEWNGGKGERSKR